MNFDIFESMLMDLGIMYVKESEDGEWKIYENDTYRLYLNMFDENLYKVETK